MFGHSTQKLQRFNYNEPKTDTFGMHSCNVVHLLNPYVFIVHNFIGVELGEALVLGSIPLKLLTWRCILCKTPCAYFQPKLRA